MKKLLLLLGMVIFGISNFTVNAQGSWMLQTNPVNAAGESMQFVSATDGWISLSNNQLLHTTNAGSTWSIVTPNTSLNLDGMDAPGKRISFVNASTGWVLKTLSDGNQNGLGAVLLKTTNGGASWSTTTLSNNVGDAGIQVQFVDANNGWVLIFNMNTSVATFLKTTNGGTTWTPTNGGGIFQYLNSTVGYAFSASPQGDPPYNFYKTTDGGSTWTTLLTDFSTGSFEAMHFSDVNNGWIVGENGKILKTTNGGANWTTITNAGINNTYRNQEVQFLNANLGWIATRDSMNNQYVLKTTNGGTTWTMQQLPFTSKVYSMNFWDENNGWATSDTDNQSGIDYPGRIARYFYDPSATYSNATLNGPWFYYLNVTPIDPYNDNLGYMIFNGNGTITGMNGFLNGPPPTNYGWYSVAANGQITGELIIGDEMFPLGGVLTSQTTGTMTGDGFNFILSKIANPGELQDNISGNISTSECGIGGNRIVSLNINNLGQISSVNTGFIQAIGHVFADQGVFIGHFYTGDVQPWTEITIAGYYENNVLTGLSNFDMQSCNYGNVGMVRNNLSNSAFSVEKVITIYPNPNNGNFIIKFNEPKTTIQIEIYDVLGQKVFANTYNYVNDTIEVYFEPQKQGVYFIKVYDGISEYKDKILIK